MNRFKVRFTPEAEADLLRLFDFLLAQDAAAAEKARAAVAKAIELLEVFAFSCRKALGGDGNPFLRELIIPFGGSGYVALFGTGSGRAVRRGRRQCKRRSAGAQRCGTAQPRPAPAED